MSEKLGSIQVIEDYIARRFGIEKAKLLGIKQGDKSFNKIG
jgi:hypothetical protein